jgi:GcrA cell cycle regulator
LKEEDPMSNIAPDYDWNDAAIAELRSLWDEGLATAEIGRRLRVSKSAVIGKAHRLHLPGRPSPIGQLGPKSSNPARKRTPVPRLTEMVSIEACGQAARRSHNPPPSQSVSPLPSPSRTTTKACCWPIGEPGTRGFTFCDNPADLGKSYCEEHAKVAYVSRRYRDDVLLAGAQSD